MNVFWPRLASLLLSTLAAILLACGTSATRTANSVAVTPMSARPQGRHRGEEVSSVRWVVLHMIEETAAHSGHLEIARELIDGRTDRGLR